MSNSLKSRLLSYLQRNYPRVISSGELQRLAMEAGYSAQNAGRRLREMEVAGQVLVTYGNKNAASYQFKLKESGENHCPLCGDGYYTNPMCNRCKNGKTFTPAPVCPPEKIQTKLI